MMQKPWIIAACLSGLCLVAWKAVPGQEVSTAEPQRTAEAAPPLQADIEEEVLRKHLTWITDDRLLGRPAFSEQAQEVAGYLESELRRYGVLGGMGENDYRQDVVVNQVAYAKDPELTIIDTSGKSRALVNGAQFRVSGDRRSVVDLEAIQLVHANAEGEPPCEPRADLGVVFAGKGTDWRTFRKAQGAAGWAAILHYQPGREEQKQTPGRRPMRGNWLEPTWNSPEPTAIQIRLYGDKSAWIEKAQILQLQVFREVEQLADTNVVGIVPGVGTKEHPEWKNEVIVLSAHFDHLGVKRARDPEKEEDPDVDSIYNGADDDASGVAVLLELAEAYAAGEPPARTVLFLFAAAEEKGILGTKCFIKRPPMALENIVCNLNLEMLGRPDPEVGGPGKLWLTGFERSSLGPAFVAAGIAVVQDPRPKQRFSRAPTTSCLWRRGWSDRRFLRTTCTGTTTEWMMRRTVSTSRTYTPAHRQP